MIQRNEIEPFYLLMGENIPLKIYRIKEINYRIVIYRNKKSQW